MVEKNKPVNLSKLDLAELIVWKAEVDWYIADDQKYMSQQYKEMPRTELHIEAAKKFSEKLSKAIDDAKKRHAIKGAK